MLKAGELNQRILIERPTRVIDPEFGPQPDVWVAVATVWAKAADFMIRKEETQAAIRQDARRTRFTIRWRSDITTDMRVTQIDRGNRVSKITAGPNELGFKEGLEFVCESFSTTGDST
jgi:SPP1 family predicted phage head-tail adaptor